MSKSTQELIDLINRSPDIGDGWRKCSFKLWPLVFNNANREVFQLSETNHCVRIKPIPTSLLNQIKEWEIETKKQIEAHDRHERIRSQAADMIWNS